MARPSLKKLIYCYRMHNTLLMYVLRASDLKLLLDTRPTQFSSADDMKSTVGACLENGAQGISIYNYGLVQIEHLRWVGQMRDLWEVP